MEQTSRVLLLSALLVSLTFYTLDQDSQEFGFGDRQPASTFLGGKSLSQKIKDARQVRAELKNLREICREGIDENCQSLAAEMFADSETHFGAVHILRRSCALENPDHHFCNAVAQMDVPGK